MTGTTNSSGGYSFGGLYSGSYLITVVTPPPSHYVTYDLDGSGGTVIHPVTGANVSSNGSTRVVLLA
jgi:hypothetical protein